MTYSYTQISQYLTCPRRYRHRYLDGWKEKDTRAAMLFGRAFERALRCLLSPGRPRSRSVRGVVGMSEPGFALFERRFLGSHASAGNHALDSVLPRQSRPSPSASTKSADQVHATDWRQNDFVAYIDAIGKLDGTPCLLEWKTSSCRYPEEPEGCCLWIRSWSATPG